MLQVLMRRQMLLLWVMVLGFWNSQSGYIDTVESKETILTLTKKINLIRI